MQMNTQILRVILDKHASIVEFSKDAEQITGYASEDIIGKNWFEVFIPNANIEEVTDTFNKLINGNIKAWEHTNDITCKDGTIKTLKWNNNLSLGDNFIQVISEGHEV